MSAKTSPSDLIVKFSNCLLSRFAQQNTKLYPKFKIPHEFHVSQGDRVAVIGTAASGRSFLLESICGDHHVEEDKMQNCNGFASPFEYSTRPWHWFKSKARRLAFQETSQFNYGGGGTGFYQQRFESQGDSVTLTLDQFFSGQMQFILDGNFDEKVVKAMMNSRESKGGIGASEEDMALKRKRMYALVDQFLKNSGLTLDTTMMKLSNGQLRRARLVAAILDDPELLVLDEPFMGLDSANQKVCAEMIEQEYLVGHSDSHKRSVIVAIRPQDHLPAFVNKVVVLGNHRIVWSGPKDEYLKKANSYGRDSPLGVPYMSDFFYVDSPSKWAGRYPIATDGSQREASLAESIVASQNISEMGVRTSESFLGHPGSGVNPEIIVEFNDVNVSYGGVRKLHGINWKVNQGDRWVLWGGNGSGKSTIMSLMVGDHPQAFCNDVRIFGKRRGTGETIFDLKTRCGLTSPELHYFFDRGVTVEAALTSRYNLMASRPPREEILAQVLEGLSDFGIDSSTYLSRRFGQLSSAEQRVLLYIRAFLGRPDLVLLDEPFQGLDIGLIHACHDWMQEKILSGKSAIILVTHNVEEIPGYMNDLIVLKEGHVVAKGPLMETISHITH